MATALRQLKKELGQAEAQLSQLPIAQRISKIRSAISTLGGTSTSSRPKRRMSAATRKKLSEAARKRWSGKTKAAKA